jgi:hypothetical protein
VLVLSAPATPLSVGTHAWCQAEGMADRIGARIVDGEARQQALFASRWLVESTLRQEDTLRSRDTREADKPYTMARLKDDERAGKLDRLVVLQCQRTLPADTQVSLVWGAGIAAANGAATAADQTLSFKTRPDFSAKLRCERVSARAQCIPFLPMRVEFSAPISVTDARAIYLQEAGGKRHPAVLGKDEERGSTVNTVSLPGPFPEQARLSLHLPDGLKDDAGRVLVNRARFPLDVRTDQAPPLVKFAAPFGILEAKGDRMLPVTVRNVEPKLAAQLSSQLSGPLHSTGAALQLKAGREQEVIAWLRRLAAPFGGWTPQQPSGKQLEASVFAGVKADTLQRFTLPKPNGRRAFEVIGIPLREPGFYVVELASPRLGRAQPDKGRTAYVHSAALVTNMAAHFKLGAESSLVWVTSLDKGGRWRGAQVEVRAAPASCCGAAPRDANGVARIRKELPAGAKGCRHGDGYFVSARSGDDFTFTCPTGRTGIEPWRFNLNTESLDDSRIAATVFDRTLLRAGETVHMKHFLRRHTLAGLALVRRPATSPILASRKPPPASAARPAKGFIIHQGTGDKTARAGLGCGRPAPGEWKIPQDAKLGVYDVMVGGQVRGPSASSSSACRP